MGSQRTTNEQDKRDAERPTGNGIDEALDETFPASDAPANTIDTGARIAPVGDVKSTRTPKRTTKPPAGQ